MSRGDLRGGAGVVAASSANATTLAGVTPTAAGLALLDDADAAAQRVTLGVVIGTNVQAQDADLQALADNSTAGLWARTGAGTGAARTITGTTNLVTVTNGDGVSGNPTITVGANVYQVGGTDVPLTDGGTGASDRRTAAANLWVRQLTRVTYLAQGDGFQSERGQPSNLLSSAIGVSGDRIFWRNSSSASSGTPGWTTLPSRHLYTTGGVYMGGVVSWLSFTNVRCYFGARNGSSPYTAGRTAFGSVIWMGFALDTDAGDTTLWMVTSDGSTVSQTNTGLTPTAGGWLFLEWYRLGSTVYWTVANCTDITATSFSSSATGTHTGSMPTGQTIGWQMTATPASGTPSLNVDMAILSVGQY